MYVSIWSIKPAAAVSGAGLASRQHAAAAVLMCVSALLPAQGLQGCLQHNIRKFKDVMNCLACWVQWSPEQMRLLLQTSAAASKRVQHWLLTYDGKQSSLLYAI